MFSNRKDVYHIHRSTDHNILTYKWLKTDIKDGAVCSWSMSGVRQRRGLVGDDICGVRSATLQEIRNSHIPISAPCGNTFSNDKRDKRPPSTRCPFRPSQWWVAQQLHQQSRQFMISSEEIVRELNSSCWNSKIYPHIYTYIQTYLHKYIQT